MQRCESALQPLIRFPQVLITYTSNASRLSRAGTCPISPRTFSHYIRTTRYSNPHSNDSLSLSVSRRTFHLPFSLPLLVSLPLSSFSLWYFATSFPINIYELVAFPSDFLIRQQSVRSSRTERGTRSNRYGHDARPADRRRSTWNNRERCDGTQFHEQWSGITLRIERGYPSVGARLVVESDDEYYAAEWGRARDYGERNCEFHMLIYSRRFSRAPRAKKRDPRSNCNCVIIESWVGKAAWSIFHSVYSPRKTTRRDRNCTFST